MPCRILIMVVVSSSPGRRTMMKDVLCSQQGGGDEGARHVECARCRKTQMHCARLEKSYSMVVERRADAEARVLELDSVALDLENELSRCEARVEALEKSDEEKSGVIDALKERCEELESDLSAREWRIEDLVGQVNELRDAYAAVGSGTEGWRQREEVKLDGGNEEEEEGAGLEEALRESRREYDSLVFKYSTVLEAMEKKIRELKAAAAESGAAASSAEGDIIQPMPSEEVSDGGMALHYRRKIRNQMDMMHSLEDKLKGVEQAYEELHGQFFTVKKENEEMNGALKAAREEHDRLEKALQKQHEVHDRKMKQLEDFYVAKTETIQKEMEVFDDGQASKLGIAVASALEEGYRSKFKMHEEELEQARAASSTLQQAVARLERDTVDLQQKAEDREEEVRQNKCAIKKLEAEKGALMSIVEELKSALAKAEEHNDKQRRELSQIRGDRKKREKENASVVVVAGAKSLKPGQTNVRGTPLRPLPVNAE